MSTSSLLDFNIENAVIPETLSSMEWAEQSWTCGAPNVGVSIGANTRSVGTSIVDNGDSTFTLQGGKRYRIGIGAGYSNMAASTYKSLRLFDITNTIYTGNGVSKQSPGHGSAENFGPEACQFFLEPAVDTTYHLRVNSGGGSTITIGNSSYGHSYLIIEEVPTNNVVSIDPGAVAVDDQASSGYMDIGAMRMQWGTWTANVSFGDVVFPAPFANTSYAFTANIEAGLQDQLFTVMHRAKTTTQVHFDKTFHAAGGGSSPSGATGENFDWFAIGLKP